MRVLTTLKKSTRTAFIAILCLMSIWNYNVASAITQNALNSIKGNTPFYDPTAQYCDGSGTATTAQTGFTPNKTAADAVIAGLKAPVTVGYAMYDATGKPVASNTNAKRQNFGASITKSMLLAVYLNQQGSTPIASGSLADTNLTNMITISSNDAANWVYQHITNANTSITTFASSVGMPGFKIDTSDPLYKLGQSLVTADDFAKYFSNIDQPQIITDAGHRSYALNLLSHLKPPDNQQGLLQSGLPDPVYSKEGWKSESNGWVVNQAAHFTLNNTAYGVAVTVSGAQDEGTGEGIVRDVVKALLSGGGTSSTTSATTGGGAVSGSISPRVGEGMPTAEQQKFQQFAVAAGQAVPVVGSNKTVQLDPNLIAVFYLTETGTIGDSSGNNGDSAKPPPYNGDGKWKAPGPPVGNSTDFFVDGYVSPGNYQPNSLGYYPPYGLNNNPDMSTYGRDGDGDGKKQPWNLADAMFTAAGYIVNRAGVSGLNVGDAAAFKAGVSYNGSQYAQSVRNTYHYLVSGGTINVTGTVPAGGGTNGCTASLLSSTSSSASCQGAAQVTGTARILAAAECYKGVYYEWAGGHQGYAAFKKGCPNPSSPPNNQPHGGPVNGDPSGLSGNPSPCGLDCSGLVSIAVDDAFHLDFDWAVHGGTMQGGAGAQFWKSIPWDQAQPGDIVTASEHVEILVSRSGTSLKTFGAHQTGDPISEVGGSEGDYPGGAWRWTGPQGGGTVI